jgi:hypothetical protein
MAWASLERDVMGDLERPLEGVVARLYESLVADEGFLRTGVSGSMAAHGRGARAGGGADL